MKSCYKVHINSLNNPSLALSSPSAVGSCVRLQQLQPHAIRDDAAAGWFSFSSRPASPPPFEACRWGKKTNAFAPVSLREFPLLRWSIPPQECSLRKVFFSFFFCSSSVCSQATSTHVTGYFTFILLPSSSSTTRASDKKYSPLGTATMAQTSTSW